MIAARSAPLRLIIKLIGRIPLELRIRLGRTLAGLVAQFPSREQKIARLHLSKIYRNRATPPSVTQVYAHMGQVALESLNLWPILLNPDRFPIIHNRDLVENCKQTGALALTAHFGNWDLLAACMVHVGVPINAIAKQTRSRVAQDLLTDLRDSYGIHSLWREDPHALKAIVDCFKKKKVVAALIDQDTRVSSQHSNFFGIQAKTPSGLVVLAQRLNIPIVSAFCALSKSGRYEVWVEEFNPNYNLQEVLDEFNQRLEKMILLYPDQWVWFHKRWRTTISQHTMSSQEYIHYLESL